MSIRPIQRLVKAKPTVEGAGVRECRGFVPEIVTPWRADAVVTDRLRVGLDALGGILGVTGERR